MIIRGLAKAGEVSFSDWSMWKPVVHEPSFLTSPMAIMQGLARRRPIRISAEARLFKVLFSLFKLS